MAFKLTFLELQLADLPAPQLEAVDVADVGLPRLLVPVGVVAVGAVEGHVHVLGLDVADDFALNVLLPAGFANPVSTPTTFDEEASRYQVIIVILDGKHIFGRAARSTTAAFKPSSAAASASGRPGNGPVV